MRGEVWAERQEGLGRRRRKRRARRAPDCEGRGLRARAERTWNMWAMPMTLEVSKLSGLLNADAPCRVESRAYDAGRGAACGREGRRRRASGMHGRARLKAGGQGTRGAHLEHVLHVCDAGRVEAQRLFERRRELPSRTEGIRCGARCRSCQVGRREEAGDRGARSVRERADWGHAGHGEERTQNMASMLVTLEVSKVSGWLNADACCRVEREVYDARLCGMRGKRAWDAAGDASGMRLEGLLVGLGPGLARSAPRTCSTCS